MKQLTLLVLALCASPAYASFSLVAHTGATSSDTHTVTTSGINTTGANLILVAIGYYQDPGAGVPCVLSDSVGGNSNTYTALTAHSSADATSGKLFYTVPTHVGSGHTFTCTDGSGFATFPGITVTAWSGAAGDPPLDQQNRAESMGSVTTVQPGSITPGQTNELLITTITHIEASASVTVDSGFTVSDDIHLASGTGFGIAMAYIIETSIVAKNPTWTTTTSHELVSDIISFTDTGGGAAMPSALLSLGVGK